MNNPSGLVEDNRTVLENFAKKEFMRGGISVEEYVVPWG